MALIPMFSEFANVIPDEVPGTPQAREVEDLIDLVPSIVPISKAHIEWHHLAQGAQDPIIGAIGTGHHPTECLTMECLTPLTQKERR